MFSYDLYSHCEVVDISSADHTAKYKSALFVGGGGASSTLKVITDGGETVVFTGVVSGTVLPVLVKTVVKVGTDTSNMMFLS